MATIGKAILNGQIYLTAIMTLIAGMPHFVCCCPINLPKAESGPAAQVAVCCCCGSCGSTLGGEQQGKPSCCNQNSPGKSKGTTRSPQATGSDCTKVTGIPREPAVATIKSAKPVDISNVWAASLVVLSLPAQAELSDSVSRWTGHSPAPPTDRVISLQRLLI
jgi:hypothetical protein